jgi:plasmid rolling circle replication initiator protein Rep
MEKDSRISGKNQDVDRKVLTDKSSTGKRRKWNQYKKRSLAVSNAYRTFEGAGTFSKRMEECGAWLRFLVCQAGHGMLLVAAIFCQCRLCPICQWRRSLIMFHQVRELAHEHIKHYKSDIPLLLTLTVPNVSANELSERLELMQKSWNRLMKRRPVKRVCRSWFRALEITYNANREDYHPHFHVLIMVPKNYFDKNYDLYIGRDEWLRMWQEVTGIPEITQVDIRRVKKLRKGTAIESVAAEVAKYATKPGDYVRELPNGLCEANAKVVEALHVVLRRRRLVAFGGKFKEYRKQLKMQDIDESDMVHISEKEEVCHCRICQSELVPEMYKWRLGLMEYTKCEMSKK